jgi:hypothetical protein
MAELSREHGRASGCIDDPTRASGAFAEIAGDADPLPITVFQLEVCYFRRTPQVATRLHREIEHV